MILEERRIKGHWPKGKRRSTVEEREWGALRRRVLRQLPGGVRRYGLATRRGLARAVGVDDRTVRRWLAGEDLPGAGQLPKIRRWLDQVGAKPAG